MFYDFPDHIISRVWFIVVTSYLNTLFCSDFEVNFLHNNDMKVIIWQIIGLTKSKWKSYPCHKKNCDN